MVIKRSWVFALFILWLPLLIVLLSCASIWIAYFSIDIDSIKYTLIVGNMLMSLILVVSSLNYIRHFREIHRIAEIRTDTSLLLDELMQGDSYFITFFDWSISNQCILFLTLITEIVIISTYSWQIGEHIWVLAFDSLVILIEMVLLKSYRKKMLDLEMDYNIVVPGKIFFVNQSGVLSSTQTLESEKIKTVRSFFPSKLASFFNFGNIDILTEGDSQAMLGTLNMYYVTSPDEVTSSIQILLDEQGFDPKVYKMNQTKTIVESKQEAVEKNLTLWAGSRENTLDIRDKVDDVLS